MRYLFSKSYTYCVYTWKNVPKVSELIYIMISKFVILNIQSEKDWLDELNKFINVLS